MNSGLLTRRHQRFGWTVLFFSFLFGATIEGLLGLKSTLIYDPLRHDLWSLAHFHGAFFGLMNLLYPIIAARHARTWTSAVLMIGSAVLPLGFLLGGIAHPEGDPSAGILLAPIGAVLVAIVALDHALRSWRGVQE